MATTETRADISSAVPAAGIQKRDGQRLTVRELLVPGVQFILLTWLVWQFRIDEIRSLPAVMVVAGIGCAFHAVLPGIWKRPCYLVASLVSLLIVVGQRDALMVLAIALPLIVLLRWQTGWWWRLGALLAVVAGLVAWRQGSTAAFWPVVGSMFMFRAISYWLSTAKEKQPRTWGETFSYFLMLPNPVYPLFPVIDARVFRETANRLPVAVTIQSGLNWIMAGVVQLLLYRILKQEIVPSPLEVQTVSDGLLYLATNYGLYLRVSGQFHVCCGLLHLFGWNLPRTHDHYFLADSFTDIWRRINVYWKDFMSKTFFMPAWFWLRRTITFSRKTERQEAICLLLAVGWVFVWTWLAHSWQTFWILGRFPLRWSDGVLWLLAGVVVAVNSLWDFHKSGLGRRTESPNWSAMLGRSVRIVLMFGLVSLFWGWWTNPETMQLVLMLMSRATLSGSEAGRLLLILFGTLSGLMIWQRVTRPVGGRQVRTDWPLVKQAGWNLSVLSGLVVMVLVGQSLPQAEGWGFRFYRLMHEVQSPDERLAMVDGYYEELTAPAGQGLSGLFQTETVSRENARDFSSMLRRRAGLPLIELIPGWTGKIGESPTTVNRWGMRDRDRNLVKPAGTLRVAVMGSSVVMGYGVGDDQTLTRGLEQRLADKFPGKVIEVLNFGCGRYHTVAHRMQMERKIRAFDPDLIVHVVHQDELSRVTGILVDAVTHGIPLDDDCLNECIRRSGVKSSDPQGVIASTLSKQRRNVLQCTYERMARFCQAQRIGLMQVTVMVPGHATDLEAVKEAQQLARQAGIQVHDTGLWWGSDAEIPRWMYDREHPGPEGQQRLAELIEPWIEAELKSRR